MKKRKNLFLNSSCQFISDEDYASLLDEDLESSVQSRRIPKADKRLMRKKKIKRDKKKNSQYKRFY